MITLPRTREVGAKDQHAAERALGLGLGDAAGDGGRARADALGGLLRTECRGGGEQKRHDGHAPHDH